MKREDWIAILVVTLCCLLGVGITLWSKTYKCSNYEHMTGMKTEFKLFDGCYVQTKKGWFLKEQLRDIQAEKGDE